MGISYVDTDPKHFPGTSGRGGALFTLIVRAFFPGPQSVSFPGPRGGSGCHDLPPAWAHPSPRSRNSLGWGGGEAAARSSSSSHLPLPAPPSHPPRIPKSPSSRGGKSFLPGCCQAHRCTAYWAVAPFGPYFLRLVPPDPSTLGLGLQESLCGGEGGGGFSPEVTHPP